MPTSGTAPACAVPSSIVFGASASTATLQLTSDSTTPPGAYSVAVTAVSQGIQQTLPVPFTIQQLPASPTFGLSAGTSALSIAIAGQSAADTLTINPAGGFTGTVQLSCAVSGGTASNAPTCVVPATASVAGSSPVNATMTVNTTAATTALSAGSGRLFGERMGGIALGCLLLFMVPRRRAWAALGMVVLAACTLAVIGCGGGNSSSGTGTGGSTGTPAGDYTVTVTAASGTITTTAQIKVTVQ
jgi:hypothetical protein